MGTAFEDIVEIQRYPISFKLPNTGLRWELKCYTSEDDSYVHYVKLSKSGDGLEAEVGREMRGEDGVSEHVCLYVLDRHENSVMLDLEGGKTTGLQQYVSKGRLRLELTVDDSFMTSNEYLSRAVVLPTTENSLSKDMLTLLDSGLGCDVSVSCNFSEEVFRFHSAIVVTRLSHSILELLPTKLQNEQQSEIWRVLLHFTYSDELPECHNLEVLLVLLELGLHGSLSLRLVALVARKLILKLSADNVICIYSRTVGFNEEFPFVEIIQSFMDIRWNRESTIETIVKNPARDETVLNFIREFDIAQRVKDGIKDNIRQSLDSDIIDTDYITNAKWLISSIDLHFLT